MIHLATKGVKRKFHVQNHQILYTDFVKIVNCVYCIFQKTRYNMSIKTIQPIFGFIINEKTAFVQLGCKISWFTSSSVRRPLLCEC